MLHDCKAFFFAWWLARLTSNSKEQQLLHGTKQAYKLIAYKAGSHQSPSCPIAQCIWVPLGKCITASHSSHTRHICGQGAAHTVTQQPRALQQSRAATRCRNKGSQVPSVHCIHCGRWAAAHPVQHSAANACATPATPLTAVDLGDGGGHAHPVQHSAANACATPATPLTAVDVGDDGGHAHPAQHSAAN